MKAKINAENRAAQVESIYTRIEGISGKPLRDGYHFGQTNTNDFGRPYGEGLNAITPPLTVFFEPRQPATEPNTDERPNSKHNCLGC